MKKLKSADVELSHKQTELEFCKECALGKAKKLPHELIERVDKSEHVTIHSDIVGPMKTTSIGRKKYLVTYICSKTEYSFVFYLKNKDEQFEKFKEFKQHYELLTDTKIKYFKTDNGREYLSNAFQQYLKENGIKHLTSVEYCPQSNGKAERLNLTLLMKARCMLHSAKLNLNLWTAAVDTANYIRNRSPSQVLNGKSPYEKLFNRLPKIKHLRIFGCEAYPLNPYVDKDKFEPRAFENCIMIGYGDSEGIYWIYNTKSQKIFRSRDVTFNEVSIFRNQDDVRISINKENENMKPKLEPGIINNNEPDVTDNQEGDEFEESEDELDEYSNNENVKN